MVNIYLTGKLGSLFGKKWTLEVKSPSEAIRAINANVHGKLLQYLGGEGANKYYKIAVQKKTNLLNKEEIPNPSGQSDIYLMPTIKGSGGGAKILAGAALLALAIVSGGITLGASANAWAGLFIGDFGVGVGIAATMGASLILGGISELLTPIPKMDNSSSASDQKQSSVFQGNAGAISQGGAVPVAYGRILVSPMPISISNSSYDQAATKSTIGSVEVTELDGGGYQYNSAAN